ncbi:MAG: hypothetical protein M9927_00640 [Anaerolineae bacterium]|nr:hypothetical protein [Anaerolineae bacterium]
MVLSSVWVIGKPATAKLYTGNEAFFSPGFRLYYDGSGSYTARRTRVW